MAAPDDWIEFGRSSALAIPRWLVVSGRAPAVPRARGAGWPLGRTVRLAELEAVAVQVEGVEYVTGSTLGLPDGSGGYTPASLLALEKWEVPQLVNLSVVVGDPLPAGTPYQPTPPDVILVPLPPEVC